MQTMCLKCIRVLFQVLRLKTIYCITPLRLVSVPNLCSLIIYDSCREQFPSSHCVFVPKCCRVSKWVCEIKLLEIGVSAGVTFRGEREEASSKQGKRGKKIKSNLAKLLLMSLQCTWKISWSIFSVAQLKHPLTPPTHALFNAENIWNVEIFLRCPDEKLRLISG